MCGGKHGSPDKGGQPTDNRGGNLVHSHIHTHTEERAEGVDGLMDSGLCMGDNLSDKF